MILALALLLDRVVGDPNWIWQRVPHPVVIFGKAISALEKRYNRFELSNTTRRRNGVAVIVALLAASLLSGFVTHRIVSAFGLIGTLTEIVVLAILLAQKSLADHVLAVATGLQQGGLAGGRHAVSMIVGRDPQTLDEPAVCRAAIESLAENFSDGVVAPAFWYAVLGLPGLFAYKMLNTADSMIGHKNERYRDFGWASARLDDAANWLPARLSILLLAAGAFVRFGVSRARATINIALRDHGFHRSPNSGWPEAAMAGALELQLAGPRIYEGNLVSEPMLNEEGRATADAGDITAGVAVFYHACTALLLCTLTAVLL